MIRVTVRLCRRLCSYGRGHLSLKFSKLSVVTTDSLSMQYSVMLSWKIVHRLNLIPTGFRCPGRSQLIKKALEAQILAN